MVRIDHRDEDVVVGGDGDDIVAVVVMGCHIVEMVDESNNLDCHFDIVVVEVLDDDDVAAAIDEDNVVVVIEQMVVYCYKVDDNYFLVGYHTLVDNLV